MTTPLRQKIGLILGSVLLTFVVLELLLRLGGAFFSLRQDRLNKTATFKKDELRILCLGESTTALGGENSYPFQLEQALRKGRPDIDFVVVNKGLVSKSSADILDQLDDNLDRYQPNVVVAMIGINDRYALLVQNSLRAKIFNSLRRVRVFHLAELISDHLQHKLRKEGLPPAEQAAMGDEFMMGEEESLEKMAAAVTKLEQAVRYLQAVAQEKPEMQKEIITQIARLRWHQAWIFVAMGKHERIRSRYSEAEGFLLTALQLLPRDPGFLLELGRCYKDQGDCLKAIPYFQESIHLSKEPILAMMELGRCYSSLGRDADTYALAKEILKQKNEHEWVYPEVGSWLLNRGHLRDAELFFLKAVKINPLDSEPYARLGEIYGRQGDQARADKFRQKAEKRQRKIDGYLPETALNYQKIVDKVLKRGIKLIVMQYPLRKIDPLKDVLQREQEIIYVENKENFETALKTAKYQEFFSDNFGVNFGHCTRKGNRLIAQQLSDQIIGKILK